MALHKLSRPKIFHVDYCGCTAARLLLNDQTIRDAIDFIRQVKTKRDFVKATITVLRECIKITYNEEQNFSTNVPSTMIAGSAVGKTLFNDTVGVVYISPLNGQHFPAYVHVYRCESSRIAQKFLSRLRAYLLIETHRLQMIQLEQQLLNRNLLNIDHFNAMKSQKTNAALSSSSASSDSRQEKKPDPIKSITEELQKKINSSEPILFPPKDYDTVHAAHGDIQRAKAWKSTEPTIIGYSQIDPDNNQTRQHLKTNNPIKPDERKNKTASDNNNDRSRLATHRTDTTVDPVEAVSLAFDFLKDETGSIFTDNDGHTEHTEPKSQQQQTKSTVYHFRPPQITAVSKKLFTRNNNYEFPNATSQSNGSSRNDSETHQYNYNNINTNTNTNNNNNNNIYYRPHQFSQNGQRSRSEMYLDYDQQSHLHYRPFYEDRLVKSGASGAIMKNPIWTDAPPTMVGSQPNLLSRQSLADSTEVYRQFSPQIGKRLPSTAAAHSLYSSYPDDKLNMMTKQQESQLRRFVPLQQQLGKKPLAQSQYLDTNEFILRASDDQPFRHAQYVNRNPPRDYRSHVMNGNGTDRMIFDVYY